MRRFTLLPLALIAAAACQDQPTGPDVAAIDGPSLAAVRKGPAAAPIPWIFSTPQSLGYTTGDAFRYPNRPEPDLGGDRVVWRHMESAFYGNVNVFQALLSAGGTTKLAELTTYAGPHTSGRYTTWQDETTGIKVLDNATGQTQRIEGMWPFAGSVDIAGDKLAYLDIDARTVNVYNIATGQGRVVATWGGPDASYYYVRAVGFDGRYVAWISDGGMGMSGLGMAVFDTWTDQEHVAVPFGQGMMTGPSVDAGRVAYSLEVGDRESIFLYDIASGTTRRISDAPGRQTNPELSGGLIVWDDTRQDQNPAYVFNHDVYLYDLETGLEMPLANDATWSGDPQLDGSRVVWTERRNDRWEVLVTELAPVTLAVLRDELRRAIASGVVRRPGVAQALGELLSQAERGAAQGNDARVAERLHHFAAYANHHGRKHIDAATAERLEGLAAGVVARL
jgi:hypothetical protein